MEELGIIINEKKEDLTINKDLINWLKSKYKDINNKKYYIKVLPINYDNLDSKDIDKFAKLNINILPVLLFKDITVATGVKDIKKYIDNLLIDIKLDNVNEAEEDINNWIMDQLKNDDGNIEEPVDVSKMPTSLKNTNDIDYSVKPKKNNFNAKVVHKEKEEEYDDDDNDGGDDMVGDYWREQMSNY